MQPGSVNFVNTPESDAARLQPRYTFGFDPALAQSSPQSVSYDTLRSVNYVSGSAGWRIDGNGNAEFNNVTVRGTLRTATSGQRIEISSTVVNRVQFVNSDTEFAHGFIQVDTSLGINRLTMSPPRTLAGDPLPTFQLQSGTGVSNISGQAMNITLVTNGTGTVQLGNAGDKLAFFGSAPSALVQTVTGSRGGNAALASLITAGAVYGLWIDSSTP